MDSVGDHDGTLVNEPVWAALVGDCNTNGIPDSCDLTQGISADCNADGIPDECSGPGVPLASLIGVVSRKLHGGSVGEDDLVVNERGHVEDSNLTSESRVGGISELRLAFDVPPVLLDGSPIVIHEQQCPGGAQQDYRPYSGVSSVFAGVEGSDLVLGFIPGLATGYTYRLETTSNVASFPCRSIEVRALTGDVDSNGQVNAVDRAFVVGAWTGAGYGAATDVNLDGITNAVDRSLVIGAWTSSGNCAP